ncbi:unnamed protein product [Paramecium sonneborni]|uniref:Uncharacterized protein n=1 Tax=Paramecium sonneborni TaxID=65129 RepID=A0A8S1Q8X8_9CILI|nr:unnamed protein product [Paramecium sonneborni]
MSNLLCPQHNLPIIQIDIDINTLIGDRTVCLECPSKTRENINRVLNIYEKINKPHLDQINSIKKGLFNSTKQFQKRISQIQEILNMQINQLQSSIEKENQNIIFDLSEYEKDFQVNIELLTLTKLQQIAQKVVSHQSNLVESSSFSLQYQNIFKSIELVKQKFQKLIDEIQLNLQKQLNSLTIYFGTFMKDIQIEQIKNELLSQCQIKSEYQVVFQLDKNYETCALNDKLVFLSQKNDNRIESYQLQVQNEFQNINVSFNDIISLCLNEQQLIIRSSENEISIRQIDNLIVQKQMITGSNKEKGYNSCMVVSENNEFFIFAQPMPKIMIFIKKDNKNQIWSEYFTIEGFGWPVQDLSCHSETLNIVICTHNKDIFIWKKEITKNNLIRWIQYGDPIRKAHNERIYSVSWIKSDQFLSGGLQILNWKQNQNGEFTVIQKIEKFHIIDKFCFLRIPKILIIQESGNCLEICQIDEKNQINKLYCIKGNQKILSISQISSSIAINNLEDNKFQIIKFSF